MIELTKEDVYNVTTEPIIRFAVYGDGKLLYVGRSRSPKSYIHDSVRYGKWNVLSKYKDVSFVIGLSDDFDKKPLYTTLRDDALPKSCNYVEPFKVPEDFVYTCGLYPRK